MTNMALLVRRFAALALILVLATGTAFAATAKMTPPPDAVPLSAYQLFSLYGGKSWKWSAGAAYFAEEGRAFTAWSTDGGTPTYASGVYKLTDDGLVCFVATWTTSTGAYPTQTCFLHVAAGGVVYQRNPQGNWLVLRHARLQDGDEYAQFSPGDLVAAELPAIRTQVQQEAARSR